MSNLTILLFDYSWFLVNLTATNLAIKIQIPDRYPKIPTGDKKCCFWPFFLHKTVFQPDNEIPYHYLQNASQRRFLPIFNTYCDSKSALLAFWGVTRTFHQYSLKTLLAAAGAFLAQGVVLSSAVRAYEHICMYLFISFLSEHCFSNAMLTICA